LYFGTSYRVSICMAIILFYRSWTIGMRIIIKDMLHSEIVLVDCSLWASRRDFWPLSPSVDGSMHRRNAYLSTLKWSRHIKFPTHWVSKSPSLFLRETSVGLALLCVAHSRGESTEGIAEGADKRWSVLNVKRSRSKGSINSSPRVPPMSMLKGDTRGRGSNGKYRSECWGYSSVLYDTINKQF